MIFFKYSFLHTVQKSFRKINKFRMPFRYTSSFQIQLALIFPYPLSCSYRCNNLDDEELYGRSRYNDSRETVQGHTRPETDSNFREHVASVSDDWPIRDIGRCQIVTNILRRVREDRSFDRFDRAAGFVVRLRCGRDRENLQAGRTDTV